MNLVKISVLILIPLFISSCSSNLKKDVVISAYEKCEPLSEKNISNVKELKMEYFQLIDDYYKCFLINNLKNYELIK